MNPGVRTHLHDGEKLVGEPLHISRSTLVNISRIFSYVLIEDPELITNSWTQVLEDISMMENRKLLGAPFFYIPRFRSIFSHYTYVTLLIEDRKKYI